MSNGQLSNRNLIPKDMFLSGSSTPVNKLNESIHFLENNSFLRYYDSDQFFQTKHLDEKPNQNFGMNNGLLAMNNPPNNYYHPKIPSNPSVNSNILGNLLINNGNGHTKNQQQGNYDFFLNTGGIDTEEIINPVNFSRKIQFQNPPTNHYYDQPDYNNYEINNQESPYQYQVPYMNNFAYESMNPGIHSQMNNYQIPYMQHPSLGSKMTIRGQKDIRPMKTEKHFLEFDDDELVLNCFKLAKDQAGCRYLQQRLDQNSSIMADKIFNNVN